MIERPTILILGAGASAGSRLGFPTGIDLLLRICRKAKTDEPFVALIEDLGFNRGYIKEFIDSLEGSMLKSVDAFLEERREFTDLGKSLIAAELIPFEEMGNLILREHEPTWYEYLFNEWHTRVENYNISKLSFITFNYDRSLEYFLFSALQHAHGLQSCDAAEILKNLDIIHLHGKLGKIPFLDDEGRHYKSEVHADSVRESAQGIQIVHEGARASKEFQRAHELLAQAEVVCFLGFGYHETNIERLNLRVLKPNPHCKLYGSSFKRKLGEDEIALGKIGRKITFGGERLDCLGMLRQFPILQ